MQQDFYFYAAIFLGLLFLIAIFVIYSFNRDKLELKRNLAQKEQENFEISSNLTNLVSKNSENKKPYASAVFLCDRRFWRRFYLALFCG